MSIVRTLLFGASALYWGLWTACAGWIIFRAARGLYAPYGMWPPEELRRSFRATMVALFVHATILISTDALEPRRLFGLAIWPLLVPTAYFIRSLCKGLLSRKRLFGVPFVVIGSGEKARSAICEMLANPKLGLVPVAAFSGDYGQVRTIADVPIVGPLDRSWTTELPYTSHRVLIALSRQEADASELLNLQQKLAGRYRIVAVLADMIGPGMLLTTVKPLGARLYLEVAHRRFDRRARLLKRSFDLAISVPVFIAALPFIIGAAIAIKLSSRGPAFFSQLREGRGGNPIRIYKLRTMVPDAEARLADYLATDQAARIEFQTTFKLRNDPRIIPRVGQFLRRSSIDELPQIWNIVKGDMSLVGPRIMPVKEVTQYSEQGQVLRRDVPPGLTGFWQITHRNDSDLHIREVADSFYVNNWSVWLDSWILLKTVKVVLTGSGAY
jgi:Undecaprenyl-phosphate galactose phosphotransferase WbaP